MSSMTLEPSFSYAQPAFFSLRIRVLLLSGSVAARSHTRCLTDVIADAFGNAASQCDVWDLAEKPLPLATNEMEMTHRNERQSERIDAFRAAVRQADTVILATPVYHGSYSGVLKCALDHLGKGALAGKAVGLISHGSNMMSCGQPLDHLRPVAANLHGHVVPTQIATSDIDFRRQDDGEILPDSRNLMPRVERLVMELLSLARALRFADYSNCGYLSCP